MKILCINQSHPPFLCYSNDDRFEDNKKNNTDKKGNFFTLPTASIKYRPSLITIKQNMKGSVVEH